jgi:hypothetical protein
MLKLLDQKLVVHVCHMEILVVVMVSNVHQDSVANQYRFVVYKVIFIAQMKKKDILAVCQMAIHVVITVIIVQQVIFVLAQHVVHRMEMVDV